MITLPRQWVDKYEINSKDDLEVREVGDEILASPVKKKERRTTIDLTDITGRDLVWRHVVCAYRKGFHAVEFKFNHQITLEHIRRFIAHLTGWAITKQNKNTLIVKTIIHNADVDVDRILKEFFTLLIELAESAYEGVKNSDIEELDGINYKDYNINKISNFSLRVLSQRGYKDLKNTISYYKIVSLLEEIADEYRKISNIHKDHLKDEKIKIGLEVLGFFKDINLILKDYRDLFYNINKEELEKFHKKLRSLSDNLKEATRNKEFDYHEMLMVFSLENILHLIKNIAEERIVIWL